MATQANSDTACVLKFTGKWEGRFEPSNFTAKSMNNAIGEARLIREAKTHADNWMSRLLLAMLSTADEKQLALWELMLASQDDEAARQALALVHYRNSVPEHRERINNALAVMNAREAF